MLNTKRNNFELPRKIDLKIGMRNVVIFEKKTPVILRLYKNTKKNTWTHPQKKKISIYHLPKNTKKFRKKNYKKKYCKNFSPILVFEKIEAFLSL